MDHYDPGIKKLIFEGSAPGSISFFRKLPVVHIIGKHSFDEVYFLPRAKSSPVCFGSTSDGIPQLRAAAAIIYAPSFIYGKYITLSFCGEAGQGRGLKIVTSFFSFFSEPLRLSRKASIRVIIPASAECSSIFKMEKWFAFQFFSNIMPDK